MTLGLEKATNARDLGGHVTRDGRRVRTGLLFRANGLHSLSDSDLAVLDRLGLTCVVDFRGPDEVTRLGPDRLPPGPRLVALPVLDPEHDHDIFAVISEALKGGTDPSALDFLREEAAGGGAAGMMAQIYRRFVSGATAREGFARALRLIASAEDLPLLFHCTAGKDRTGWLAALVLHALHVDEDAIVADYLRTNEHSAGSTQFVVSLLDGRVSDPTVIVPMLEAREASLRAAFDEARRLFGDLDGYLREGLGADDALLESLRANLLD